MIDGKFPINSEYAGKTFPLEKLSQELRAKYSESVKFNEKGFPDFSPYSIAEVKLELTGNRSKDFIIANRLAGFKLQPEAYTWHHHEDAKTLILIPSDIHNAIKHTGGCKTSGLNYGKNVRN